MAGSIPENGASAPQRAIQLLGNDGTYSRFLTTDTHGRQFTVPTVPGTGSGDHPETEIVTASGSFTPTATTLVAAPGAGKNLRVFSMQAVAISGDIVGYFVTSDLAAILSWFNSTTFLNFSFPVQGYPLPENVGIESNIASGTGKVGWLITYTIETT